MAIATEVLQDQVADPPEIDEWFPPRIEQLQNRFKTLGAAETPWIPLYGKGYGTHPYQRPTLSGNAYSKLFYLQHGRLP